MQTCGLRPVARCPSRKSHNLFSRSRQKHLRPVASAALDKKQCAQTFTEVFVRDDQVIGTGSGELSSLVIETIGARMATGQLKGIQAVAMSTGAAAEAAFCGVPTHPEPEAAMKAGLDLAFVEADQLDVSSNACIIGIQSEPQQPALLQTFLVAKRSKQFVLLIPDEAHLLPRLKGPLPVLIEEETWEETAEEVDDMVVGDAEVTRRPIAGLPNPDFKGGDHPYISEDGHNIIDLSYEPHLRLFGEDTPYKEILQHLVAIPGVVLSGLMLNVAQAAVVAKEGGSEVLQLK